MADPRRVTRDVAAAALAGLGDGAPRATVAFVAGDAVEALPARARGAGESARFGIVATGAPDLDGREVVLVRDDGEYWFALRGLSVRGRARRMADAPPGADAALAWYAIEAKRVLSWDYGALREE